MKRDGNELTMYIEILNEDLECVPGELYTKTCGEVLYYELVDRMYKAIAEVGSHMTGTDALLKVDFYVHLKMKNYEPKASQTTESQKPVEL